MSGALGTTGNGKKDYEAARGDGCRRQDGKRPGESGYLGFVTQLEVSSTRSAEPATPGAGTASADQTEYTPHLIRLAGSSTSTSPNTFLPTIRSSWLRQHGGEPCLSPPLLLRPILALRSNQPAGDGRTRDTQPLCVSRAPGSQRSQDYHRRSDCLLEPVVACSCPHIFRPRASTRSRLLEPHRTQHVRPRDLALSIAKKVEVLLDGERVQFDRLARQVAAAVVVKVRGRWTRCCRR